MIRIAIDCMGGDHGVDVTVPAACEFLRLVPDAFLLLVGKTQEIKAWLPADLELNRFELIAASEVVSMQDSIEVALRRKKDSSMRVAISLVKDQKADVCVSAGNTGALMAISRYVLKTLEGIDRPAIATVIPNQKGGVTTMLDLGANVDCTPEHLLQFAVMGTALVSALESRPSPSVGLLNIGEESIKGNEVVKQTAELLRQSRLNFIGNVEGNDIFKGTADIVVCDGFVGNVALKTSEGLAQMLADFIRQEFTRNLFCKILAVLAWPVLQRFKRRVDHRCYNGAALLGLRGLVIKSHGSADRYAFGYAIRRAYETVKTGVLNQTADTIAALTKTTISNHAADQPSGLGVEPECSISASENSA